MNQIMIINRNIIFQQELLEGHPNSHVQKPDLAPCNYLQPIRSMILGKVFDVLAIYV